MWVKYRVLLEGGEVMYTKLLNSNYRRKCNQYIINSTFEFVELLGGKIFCYKQL